LKRRWTITLLGAALACAGAAAVAVAVHLTPVPARDRLASLSQLVVAENGELLRAYLAPDGQWRLATRPEDVDPRYLDVLLAYEDRRFYRHIGIDFLAFARVAAQFLQHGRITSGASTLTMQAVRLLNPGSTGLHGKITQLLGAIQLERSLSKRDILEIYLTLAPFGGNIEGVRAASLFYFGKEPNSLTLQESALLVAIAQAPARRRPDRHPLAAAQARDRVLARLADRTTAATQEPPAPSAGPLVASRPFLAPHFADRARRLAPQAGTVRTTIDAALQAKVEQIVRETLQTWPGEVNASVLVVRNSDFAVRAYVGGSDFFARESAGQFDHVRAVRSPGSALKPMIYGLGFEALIIHPSTIVTDRPVNFDGYAPQNFNEDYQGDMTVREALIKSINTTAVAVLARVTPAVLLTRLRNAGLTIQVDDVDTAAGLAVALGGGGMTLESLTRLYASFANNGVVRPLKLLVADAGTERKRVLDRDAAWALTDILADAPPPSGFGQRHAADGGRRIAYKTGTSFGYRDAWAVGFDRDHTVGIWVGRSDAAPNPGAMGVTTAAPLLHRVFDLLPTPRADVAGSSQGSVFANRVNIPARLQRLAGAAGQRQAHTLRIVFPRRGSVVAAEKDGDGTQFVPLVADGGNPPYFWFVDGASLPDGDPKIRWYPKGAGHVSATLMDSEGETSTVEFWIR
jgi:penicillin-binding protein 1C